MDNNMKMVLVGLLLAAYILSIAISSAAWAALPS